MKVFAIEGKQGYYDERGQTVEIVRLSQETAIARKMMERPETIEEAKFRQLKESFAFGYSIKQLEQELNHYSPNLASTKETYRAIKAVIADKMRAEEQD
jgi:hypothetical protein